MCRVQADCAGPRGGEMRPFPGQGLSGCDAGAWVGVPTPSSPTSFLPVDLTGEQGKGPLRVSCSGAGRRWGSPHLSTGIAPWPECATGPGLWGLTILVGLSLLSAVNPRCREHVGSATASVQGTFSGQAFPKLPARGEASLEVHTPLLHCTTMRGTPPYCGRASGSRQGGPHPWPPSPHLAATTIVF